MGEWVPPDVAVELLHRLVPAALEEDLLDDHTRAHRRDEAEQVAFGWQCWPVDVGPLVDDVAALGVEEWPALGVRWEVPDSPVAEPVRDPQASRLTADQQLALVRTVLGAVVIDERREPTAVLRLR